MQPINSNTLQQRIRTSLAVHGQARLIDAAGPICFDELDGLAAAFALSLMDSGIRPGDRVAIVATNSRWAASAYLGAWKAGAVPIGVNPALTSFELSYIFEHAKPLAVVSDGNKVPDVRAANESAGRPATSFYADQEVADATHLATLPAASQRWPDLEYSDVALLLYTSGTTGRPKGVMLTHDNIAFMHQSWQSVTQMTSSDVVFCGLPLFHVYPLILLFLSALTIGHDLVLERGFPFPRILELVSEHRVTMLPAAPVLYRALAMLSWEPDRYDFSSLRVVISGGAPIAEVTAMEVSQKLGGVTVFNGYGITETAPLIALGPVDEVPAQGSAGRVIPGVQVEIRDPGGKALAANLRGEICVKSPGVMKGYYLDPTATAEAIADGWYQTGDLGYFDSNGYLFICDRLKDMILVNGENVYPSEVEAALLEHPRIGAAAVVRTPSETTGESPLAYLVCIKDDPQPTVSELLAFLKKRLAPFKVPGKFEFVDELPISASGKILKRELHRETKA